MSPTWVLYSLSSSFPWRYWVIQWDSCYRWIGVVQVPHTFRRDWCISHVTMPLASRVSLLIWLDGSPYLCWSSLASRIWIREESTRNSSSARGILAIIGSRWSASFGASLGLGCFCGVSVSIIRFCCSRTTFIARLRRFSFSSLVVSSCIS